MNITNRLFTYPILSDEKDDYKSSIFNVSFKHSRDGVNSIKLVFDIEMTCSELAWMISSGQAEYVIHLECSSTAYREVLRTVPNHIEHTLRVERINGSLNMVAFVVLKKNISNFTCPDWVDDFSGLTFNLSAGSILAYQNLSGFEITKEYEEFTNAGSIFRIYKRAAESDKPAEINLDSSKIKIGLAEKDYNTYSTYASRTELQPILHSMLVLPALVYVFEELKQDNIESKGMEIYQSKEWFISLEKAYLKRGLNFREAILSEENTSYQLAQEAMELPISKAFDQIPILYEAQEED